MPASDSVVLGSRSPQRRELLASIVGAHAVQIMPPLSSAEADFHDVSDDAGFERRLLEIVRDKYQDVSRQVTMSEVFSGEEKTHSPFIVVADTIVIAKDDQQHKRVLGQPEPAEWQSEVRHWMRHWLAGRTHEVWTGVIVARGNDVREFIVKSSVTFCDVSDALIEWYLSTNESVGKAGGYAIQANAAAFVSQFTGSLTNIIGLPLMEVIDALQALGWQLPVRDVKD
ncbi:MAG: Maf family protein [Planctomycetaceae bacterium]